jgi:hypothetical protein
MVLIQSKDLTKPVLQDGAQRSLTDHAHTRSKSSRPDQMGWSDGYDPLTNLQICEKYHPLAACYDRELFQRGFPTPLCFHDQRLREAPEGHFFNVITNGYGAMYSYASRVETSERWAIIAYIARCSRPEMLVWRPVRCEERPAKIRRSTPTF